MKETDLQDEFTLDRAFIGLFLAVLALRILYLLAAPFDLSPDEAYYWDWSRRPDWGYYSKPPMVAWIIGLSTWLLGDTTFAVRLPAAILSTFSLAPLFLLARRLFGAKPALFSTIGVLSMPGTAVLGLAMTIDAPLIFFWSLALFTFWKAAERPERPIWWIATGLAAGLGMLSKQTMAAFIPLAFIFLATSSERKRLLMNPWPYAAAITAALCLLPILVWNMQHGWITLEHTSHHFEPNRESAISLLGPLFFLASQAGLASPILFILAMTTGVVLFDRAKSLPAGIRLLLVFGMIPLAGVSILALRQDINANWPAPFLVTSPILLAAIFKGGETIHPSLLRKFAGLYKPGLALGLALTLLLYSSPWLLAPLGLDGTHFDPTSRIRGWARLGTEVGAVLDTFPEDKRPFLVAARRQVASELAFYVPGHPRTYRWTLPPHAVKTQYELWPGPDQDGLLGSDALVVLDERDPFPQGLVSSFSSVEPRGELTVPVGKNGKRTYRLFLGRELRAW